VHTGMNLMRHEQGIAKATGQPASRPDKPSESALTKESKS
jgi:hypothetical protein